MTVFVDTSALYALLDEDDGNHLPAAATWLQLLGSDRLITHDYAVLETSALVQRRLGMRAASQLHDGLLPAIQIVVVDEATHRRAVASWRQYASRHLSLVDVTSFELMQALGVERAFVFDSDFSARGFVVEP